MPKAFLSHSTPDKRLVLKAENFLYTNFIKAWVDKKDIPGGANLWETINSGILNGQYFIPFISTHYCESSWCQEELSNAYHRSMQGEVKILPVVIVDEHTPTIKAFAQDKPAIVQTLIDRVACIELDIYQEELAFKNIADAIWAHEAVKFYPIETIEIDNQKLQRIRFQMTAKELPTTFLQTWDFNIEDFVSKDSEDRKLIQPDLPVAFSGAAPNWLISFFVAPLKNLRTVFIFNNRSGDYICVYSLDKDRMLGKTLQEGSQ